MAVYTHPDAETLTHLIGGFGVGTLVSAKGIAEGVSNSNFLIATSTTGQGGEPTQQQFIFTIYEERTEAAELPFFLGLLDHLAARGCPVPRTIHDRQGRPFCMVEGKAAALIEFLPGVSVSEPTPAQAHAVGEALALIHHAAADFPMRRANQLDPPGWSRMLADCGTEGLAAIDPGLCALITRECDELLHQWPQDLPHGTIHADLFPDNVLMLGSKVSGLIDFYFACTDLLAYDVAVTHAAWCFSADGRRFDPAVSAALLAGYNGVRALSAAESAALPLLARGAAMRFLATRAYDWIHTPPGALVTRKDPMAFARRLEFYAGAGGERVFAMSGS